MKNMKIFNFQFACSIRVCVCICVCVCVCMRFRRNILNFFPLKKIIIMEKRAEMKFGKDKKKLFFSNIYLHTDKMNECVKERWKKKKGKLTTWTLKYEFGTFYLYIFTDMIMTIVMMMMKKQAAKKIVVENTSNDVNFEQKMQWKIICKKKRKKLNRIDREWIFFSSL